MSSVVIPHNRLMTVSGIGGMVVLTQWAMGHTRQVSCEEVFFITLPRRRSKAMSQRVDAAFTIVARMFAG